MTAAAERESVDVIDKARALPPEERMVVELLIYAMTQDDQAAGERVEQELRALTDRTDLTRSQRFEAAWRIVTRDVERREAAAVWRGD